MPIDPRLSLAVQPPAVETPAEVEGRMRSLAQLAQREQMNSQAIQQNQFSLRQAADAAVERERKMQAAEKVRGILSQQPDLEKALPEIIKVDPEAGAAFSKHLEDTRKARVEAQTKALELEGKRRDAIGSALGSILSVKDPEKQKSVYRAERAALLAGGLFAPEHLPENVSEDELKAFALRALPYEKQVELGLKQAQEGRAAAKEGRDAKEFEATLPGKQAEADSKTMAALGQALGAATNQKEWTDALNALVDRGYSTARFPAVYSPEAAKAAGQLGLTPRDRASAERAAADASERVRHNKTTEAQGAERVSIARERARRGEGGGEGGAATGPSKEDRGEARKLQSEIDRIEAQLGKLYAQNEGIGALSKTDSWEKDDKGARTKGTADFARNNAEIEQLKKRRDELMGRKDKLYRPSGSARSSVNDVIQRRLKKPATAKDLFSQY